MLESKIGRQSLAAVISEDPVKLLLTGCNPFMTPPYSVRLLHFFARLFQVVDNVGSERHLKSIADALLKPKKLDFTALQGWFLRLSAAGTQQVTAASNCFTKNYAN